MSRCLQVSLHTLHELNLITDEQLASLTRGGADANSDDEAEGEQEAGSPGSGGREGKGKQGAGGGAQLQRRQQQQDEKADGGQWQRVGADGKAREGGAKGKAKAKRDIVDFWLDQDSIAAARRRRADARAVCFPEFVAKEAFV